MELFPVIPVLHVRLRGDGEAKDTQQSEEGGAHSSAADLLVVVDESGAEAPLLTDGGDESSGALSSALGVCGLVGQLTLRLHSPREEAERAQSAAIQRALKGPRTSRRLSAVASSLVAVLPCAHRLLPSFPCPSIPPFSAALGCTSARCRLSGE